MARIADYVGVSRGGVSFRDLPKGEKIETAFLFVTFVLGLVSGKAFYHSSTVQNAMLRGVLAFVVGALVWALTSTAVVLSHRFLSRRSTKST